MNKYKAIPEVCNGIQFPSKYEAQIYRIIKSQIDEANLREEKKVYALETQKKVVIYNGAFFPTRYWKCDFCITDYRSGKTVLVEAKGIEQREFSYILNLLASNNLPAFDSLVIVSENEKIHSQLGEWVPVMGTRDFYLVLQNKLKRGLK